MQNEVEIIPGSDNDPDNPKGILSRIKNPVKAALVRGKIVIIPKDKVKFLCPNHEIRTVIELKESGLRHKSNKLEEFECSCGTIYKKAKQ